MHTAIPIPDFQAAEGSSTKMIVSCLLSKSPKKWGGNPKHEECTAPTSALQMPWGQRQVHSVSLSACIGGCVCTRVCLCATGREKEERDFCSRRWRRLFPAAAHLL